VDAREGATVTVAGLSVFADAVQFVQDNPGLLWDKVVEQLELSAAAIGAALLVALPVGIGLGHLRRYSFVAISVANVGRALPTLAVIAVGIIFLPVGFWVVLIALVVLAVPPILTNAYVGVSEIDAETVEAARGMGMTERQILQRIELPLATPLLFSGIRTAVVFVVASATIAAIAGGGGLGDVIVNQASYGIEGVIGASMLVCALAFACDGVVALVQRIVTPRPLRGRHVDDATLVAEFGEPGSTL
jgi:osmoprotectant transport system permease protein